jgi:hypothetical protein
MGCALRRGSFVGRQGVCVSSECSLARPAGADAAEVVRQGLENRGGLGGGGKLD